MTGCVFCDKITDRTAEEFDGLGIYHFEPLGPVTPGHRLFVPREHVPRAHQQPAITGLTFAAAAQWAAKHEEDYNLIVNGGHFAGQTVFHLHVHYVPRRPGDGLLLPWGGVRE